MQARSLFRTISQPLMRNVSMPRTPSFRRRTPLCDACIAGNVPELRRLLLTIPPRNERRSGLEPLFHALTLCLANCAASVDIVLALADAGALEGQFEPHPAVWAVRERVCPSAFDALCAALRARDMFPSTLATQIAWFCARECCWELLDSLSRVESDLEQRVRAQHGEGLIHAVLNAVQAEEHQQMHMVRHLLESGMSDVRLRDGYGRSPAHIAKLRSLPLIRAELRQRGASGLSYASVLMRSARMTEGMRSLPATENIRATDECSICLNVLGDGVTAACGHVFHAGCLQQWMRRSAECPVCRRDATSLPALRPHRPAAPTDSASTTASSPRLPARRQQENVASRTISARTNSRSRFVNMARNAMAFGMLSKRRRKVDPTQRREDRVDRTADRA